MAGWPGIGTDQQDNRQTMTVENTAADTRQNTLEQDEKTHGK